MRKNLIGIFFILLAALVLFQGYLLQWNLSIWMISWLLLLAYLGLSNFLKRRFGWGVLYAVLALFSLNGQYHFLPVSNSVIILSSIFLVIGLKFLFKPKHVLGSKISKSIGQGMLDDSRGNDIDVSFSTVSKFLNDQAFTRGSADVSFGAATVYLDGCKMSGTQASFQIDISFGSLILYVPSQWRVHTDIDNSFSTVTITDNPSDLTSKDLYITGDLSFSNLTIRYVEENSLS